MLTLVLVAEEVSDWSAGVMHPVVIDGLLRALCRSEPTVMN